MCRLCTKVRAEGCRGSFPFVVCAAGSADLGQQIPDALILLHGHHCLSDNPHPGHAYDAPPAGDPVAVLCRWSDTIISQQEVRGCLLFLTCCLPGWQFRTPSHRAPQLTGSLVRAASYGLALLIITRIVHESTLSRRKLFAVSGDDLAKQCQEGIV